MKIRVECLSGYKLNERPIKFWIGSDVFFIESIQEQWYGPEAAYFRVHADDGNSYVLSYNNTDDEWTLETIRGSLRK